MQRTLLLLLMGSETDRSQEAFFLLPLLLFLSLNLFFFLSFKKTIQEKKKKNFATMAPNKLKLHTYPGNKNANKALIVAEYSSIQIDVPRFEMGKSNKTPEFLKLNPFGKVPTLETAEGEGVFESNAIARFVARQSPSAAAQLLGKTPIEQAQVDAWGERFFFSFLCFFVPFLFPLFCVARGKTKALYFPPSLFSLSPFPPFQNTHTHTHTHTDKPQTHKHSKKPIKPIQPQKNQ